MSSPLTVIRVFERGDGSQVLVYFWPISGLMEVAERPVGGHWGPPISQLRSEDVP